MINKEVIEKAAKLSSLVLSEDQQKKTLFEMSKFLDHFEGLGEIDTEGVEPLYTPVAMENVWREDTKSIEQTKDELLAVLAETMEGQLKVPQVV